MDYDPNVLQAARHIISHHREFLAQAEDPVRRRDDGSDLLQIAQHIISQCRPELAAEDPVRRDDLALLKVARHFIDGRRQQLAQEEDHVMRRGQRQWIAGLEAKSDDELCHYAARLILYAALDSEVAAMETPTRLEDLGGGFRIMTDHL